MNLRNLDVFLSDRSVIQELSEQQNRHPKRFLVNSDP